MNDDEIQSQQESLELTAEEAEIIAVLEKGIRLVKHKVDDRYDGLGGRSELGSSGPGGLGQFSDTADGQIGEVWRMAAR
jgi:hypothetical protein